MKLAIAILALAIAIPAIAGDTAWYNADLQRLQWQRPGKVTVGGTDYGPNPHPDLVVAAGWQSLALDCAWTDTVTDWEESPPVRCMTQEELEEERRVFHVAVTRARDELYLIVPEIYRNRGGNLVMMKPSRFLTELSRELTEQMELEEGLPHLIGGNERNCLPPGEQT